MPQMLVTRHLTIHIYFVGFYNFGTYHICVVATDDDDDASGTSMRCTMVYEISG
jgi:hypothetical protein